MIPSRRPIDDLLERVRERHPTVRVGASRVPGLAEGGGIWFLRHPGSPFAVQVRSDDGDAPFHLESDEDDEHRAAPSVDDALRLVRDLLHLRAEER